MIELLEHRGGWCDALELFDDKALQNTIQAFEKSLRRGNGIETDFRDAAGQLVIAHDLAQSTDERVETFLSVVAQQPRTLAINIKADGLYGVLAPLLKRYHIEDYFCFDM